MRNRYSFGQEAVEFTLITVLVFFAAFFTLMIFGDKLAGFFNGGSSVSQAANTENSSSMLLTANSTQKYEPDYETEAPEEITTKTVGNYELQFNEKGDVMFQAAGQNVMLTSDVVNNLNVVFETSGADGLAKVLDQVAYVINKQKPNYPDSDVPFDLIFGDGVRTGSSGLTQYKGRATVNSIALKSGNDIVLIQKDQRCKTSQGKNGCLFSGTYTIKGSLNSNNVFKGSVGSNVGIRGSYKATFSGETFSNGQYELYRSSDGYRTNYSWNFNFN